MKNKKFFCPTCNSLITERKYYEITGIVEAKLKAENEIKLRLKETEQQKKELSEKHRLLMTQMGREKKLAIKEGIEKGKLKEKSRADKMANQAEAYLEQVESQNKKIKELQKQLRKGTTAQDEGRNFEHELVERLKKEFPSDTIEHHGHAGDILHKIILKSREIGRILYECKKTATFQKNYIDQTKRAKADRNANYGVLVTFITKKDTQGFYVENDIIVVHPYGTIYIAQVLRKSIVELNTLKVGRREIENRAQDLMDFIKGNDFKNSVENSIYRTRELAKSLQKEVKNHEIIWKERYTHYGKIFANTQKLEIATSNILNGIPAKKGLDKVIMKQLPAPNKK